MKRKQNKRGLARGRTSAKAARGGRAKAKMSAGRGKKTSRMTAKAGARAKPRSVAKPKARASSRARTGKAAKTKRASGARGLVKAMSRIKGKAPLKSTSEMRAKRASSRKALKSTTARGVSAPRRTRAARSSGTSGRVSASTKPSFGRIDISEIQRTSVDERLSPQADKPYTGSDAFKPDAKGAETLMSSPPRKPIRQSRNQVGVRHH